MGILFSFHDELRYTIFLYRPPLAYCFCCRRSSSSFFFLFCCVRRYHSLRTFLCLKILLHKTSLPLGLGPCVRWNKKNVSILIIFFIMILYHYFLKVYRIKNTLSNRGVYQKNEHNCLWMLVSKYFHTFFIVRPEETRRHRVRHQ